MHPTRDLLHQSPEEIWLPDAAVPAVSVIDAGVYSAVRGRDFPVHQHTYWEWVYYYLGAPRAQVGNAAFDTRPGLLLITPPGEAHSDQARTAYTVYFVGIEASPAMTWPLACYDDADGTIATLLALLVREWKADRSGRTEMLRLLLAQIDLVVRRLASAQSENVAEQVVRQAERLLRERVTHPSAAQDPLRLSEIAREVGVSPSTLRIYFARLRGYAPREFAQQARLERALALLRTSDLTLDAVADRCGYCSASHLSRCVKSHTGKSPGTLRET